MRVRATSPGNMQRAWILLTLGLMACVSAETVSGPSLGRALLWVSRQLEEPVGNWGAPPGGSATPERGAT